MSNKIVEDEGVDAVLRRLVTHSFGVLSYVVLNREGIPVQFHGMEQEESIRFAGLVSEMVNSTREFLDKQERERDPLIEPELNCLRMRTRKHEIIVCPDSDFTVITVQDPNYDPKAAQAAEEEKKKEEELLAEDQED